MFVDLVRDAKFFQLSKAKSCVVLLVTPATAQTQNRSESRAKRLNYLAIDVSCNIRRFVEAFCRRLCVHLQKRRQFESARKASKKKMFKINKTTQTANKALENCKQKSSSTRSNSQKNVEKAAQRNEDFNDRDRFAIALLITCFWLNCSPQDYCDMHSQARKHLRQVQWLNVNSAHSRRKCLAQQLTFER